MFDGAVAATKQRDQKEKRYGIQIDSLCDLICFGVLPGLFIYFMNEKTLLSFLAAYICSRNHLVQGNWVGIVTLVILGICYLLPIRIKKPQTAGKLALVVTGSIEIIGWAFSMRG